MSILKVAPKNQAPLWPNLRQPDRNAAPSVISSIQNPMVILGEESKGFGVPNPETWSEFLSYLNSNNANPNPPKLQTPALLIP